VPEDVSVQVGEDRPAEAPVGAVLEILALEYPQEAAAVAQLNHRRGQRTPIRPTFESFGDLSDCFVRGHRIDGTRAGRGGQAIPARPSAALAVFAIPVIFCRAGDIPGRFAYDAAMASSVLIRSLIIEQLAGGEKRLLGLVVAVRKALGHSEKVKGDLSDIVRAALRGLVASKEVVQVDGMYVLSKPEVAGR